MSRNLTDILRAHEGEDRPDRPRRAQGGDGRARRDHRRRPAPCGRAVGPARGDRLRRLDASTTTCVQPRGERHVRGLHRHRLLGRRLRRPRRRRLRRARARRWASARDDGSVSLGETVCLGFCHTRPAGARRRRGRRRPGRGRARARRRAAPGATSPTWRACSTSRCCSPGRLFEGLRHARESLAPEELLDEVKDANVRGRGGAGFPAGHEVGVRARAAERRASVIVVNGDEGDPGSYIDKLPDGAQPRRCCSRAWRSPGYAVGAGHGLRPRALRVPALEARPARGGRAARARAARRGIPAATSRST